MPRPVTRPKVASAATLRVTHHVSAARITPTRPKTAAGVKSFKTKAQWRWAFATHQAWAHKAAHATKGGKKSRYDRLPERKGASARTAR